VISQIINSPLAQTHTYIGRLLQQYYGNYRYYDRHNDDYNEAQSDFNLHFFPPLLMINFIFFHASFK